MRLLADENIDAAMVAWLRDQGLDVIWVAESFPGTGDSSLLEIANNENRILLTRDLDFGGLVFREKRISQGIILLRIDARNQYERLETFKTWWGEIQANAVGHFLTVSNDRIRIRVL